MIKVLKKLMNKPVIGAFAKWFVQFMANREVSVIAKHFSTYFDPQLASHQNLRQESFKIRHQVYCDELSFEPLQDSGMETDEFDPQSLICVIQHRVSQTYAGTVRIVCSNSDEELLPLEKYCEWSISEENIKPKDFPRNKICEISRLAVPASFRRRTSDQHKGAATGVIDEINFSEKELRCFPFIAVGLYLSAAAIVVAKGIDHCFVMMEPRLARSMKMVGIEFTQIGPVVEYHGKRAPYYIDPHQMIAGLRPGFRALFEHIHKDLKSHNDISANFLESTILNAQKA